MDTRFNSEYKWGQYGELVIDHADIFWTNFRGEERINRNTGKVVNNKGTRVFNVYIYNTELAEEMRDEGWNIGIKTNIENGDVPLYYIPVEVRWRNKDGEFLNDGLLPKPYMEGEKGEQLLDEETIGQLDSAYISDVGLVIRKRRYEDSFTGEHKIKAFLAEGWFVVEENHRGDAYRRAKSNVTGDGKFWDAPIEDKVVDVLEDLERVMDSYILKGGREGDREIDMISGVIRDIADIYGLTKN